MSFSKTAFLFSNGNKMAAVSYSFPQLSTIIFNLTMLTLDPMHSLVGFVYRLRYGKSKEGA